MAIEASWLPKHHPALQSAPLMNIAPLLKKFPLTPCFVDISRKGSLELSVIREKAQDRDAVHLCFDSYVTASARWAAAATAARLRTLWKKVRTEPGFRSSFDYKSINLWPLLAKQFNCYFDVRLKDHLLNYEGLRQLLTTEKPAAVVTPTTTGPFERALFAHCHMQRIPVVNIQQGVLSVSYPGYVHPRADVSQKREAAPRYCPLPDKTLVFGPYYKKLLEQKSAIPASRIAITGDSRYDAFSRAGLRQKKNAFCKKMGIDGHKALVLFATQPFDVEHERDELMRAVCKAVATMDRVQLVVKVHPSEEIERYQQIAAQEHVAAVVTKNIPVHDALLAADVLLTAYSTVGIDAMMMNKPVISINLSGRTDPVPYASSGAALGVYERTQLGSAITAALFDGQQRKKLQERMKSFVYEQCFVLDGKASQRMAAEIARMVHHG